jgi:xylan 1,4-beta-xylosidase
LDGKLSVEGIGKSISETQPLTIMPANDSYQICVNVSGSGNSKGGLVLYYNSKYYVGLEFSKHSIFKLYNNGDRGRLVSGINQDSVYLRLKDDHNDLLCYYSLDGVDWKRM